MTRSDLSDRELRFLAKLETAANPEYSLPIFADMDTDVWHVGDDLTAPDPLPLEQLEKLAAAGLITFQTFRRAGIQTHFGRLTDMGRGLCSSASLQITPSHISDLAAASGPAPH